MTVMLVDVWIDDGAEKMTIVIIVLVMVIGLLLMMTVVKIKWLCGWWGFGVYGSDGKKENIFIVMMMILMMMVMVFIKMVIILRWIRWYHLAEGEASLIPPVTFLQAISKYQEYMRMTVSFTMSVQPVISAQVTPPHQSDECQCISWMPEQVYCWTPEVGRCPTPAQIKFRRCVSFR